eukprot:CAMPEP_0196823454 /NCGR_PEP_ID=MMETSP1362-20130617/87533_1 /TAXON_ID=163516 /ORGANISM="Leptocylindrus danicus, Strain CCMP1856" /LENGTH=478 /DNA_ID=CAMNT_0042203329 /DNA_START=366 /DNA_END=1799 /DNA_ORIENTATION=+
MKTSSPSRRSCRERISRSTPTSPSKSDVSSSNTSYRGRKLNERRALAMTAAKLMNEEKQQRSNNGASSSSSNFNAKTLDSLSSVSAGTSLHGATSSSSPSKRRARRHRNNSSADPPSLMSSADGISNSKSISVVSGGGSPRRNAGIRQCHSTFGTKEEETSLRERMEQRLNIGARTSTIIKPSASTGTLSYSSHSTRQKQRGKGGAQNIDAMLRYEHYKRLNRLGALPHQIPRSEVKLNIYDLLENDALLDVEGGWCNVQFPIGACFKHMNDGLHLLGTGAYHVGVEVDNVEYAFGAHNMPNMTGVFTCRPRQSPGFSYRTTIDFGRVEIKKKIQIEVPAGKEGPEIAQSRNRQLEIYVNAKEILQELSLTYLGTDYNLLRKNCCTFARDALLHLGIEAKDIPSWFINISEAGAMTEDVVTSVDNTLIMPIRQMFSESEEDADAAVNHGGDGQANVMIENAQGFEVVLGQRKITEVNI